MKNKLKVLGVFMVAAMLGGSLLYVSQNVQQKHQSLGALQRKSASERDAIKVLEAEWAYLNAPERLEQLAVQHFGVTSPTAMQMIDGESAASVLPFPDVIENVIEGGGVFTPVSYSGGAL